MIAFLSPINLSSKNPASAGPAKRNLMGKSEEFLGTPNQGAVLDLKLVLWTTLHPQAGSKLTLHVSCQNWNAPQHCVGSGTNPS